MRITLKTKKYPELLGLSSDVIAVIVDEAVNVFLKSEQGKALCEAFSKSRREDNLDAKDN